MYNYDSKWPYGFLVLLIALSLIGGFIGGATVTALVTPSSVESAPVSQPSETRLVVEESSVIDTVKTVSPAVVSVVISKDLPLYRQRSMDFNQFFFDPFNFNTEPFDQYQRDEDGNVLKEKRKVGGGSGFIISSDGLMLTNKHVVQDEDAEYTVVLQDGSEYTAEILGRDPFNDIAVARILPNEGEELPELPVAALGNSSDLQIGQKVVAIGNALAEYQNSVTTGVISAKNREITAGSVNGSEALINLLQTDAAINPGNSGGPLVNLNGEVIGINTAIASGAEGIGFAIPIDDVKSIVDNVKKNGEIVRPYLGVRYMMLDAKRADELDIDVEGGALLVGDELQGKFAVIPGGPGDKAGLQIRDVILEIDGQTVDLDNTLQSLIGHKQPGDTIQLKVWRSGEIIELEATLDKAE